MCNNFVIYPLFLYILRRVDYNLWAGESVTEPVSHFVQNRWFRDPYSILYAHEAVHVLRQQNIIAKALYFVRRRRIELLSQPWQGRVLPLNQHRIDANTSIIGLF